MNIKCIIIKKSSIYDEVVMIYIYIYKCVGLSLMGLNV